jgi:hypothetical protein
MLALIAMVIFIRAIFKVTLGELNMYLGLAFLSAHFALGGFGWYAGRPGRRAP